MLPSPIGQLFLSPGFTNICTSFLQSINFFINTQDNVITITIVGVFPPSSSILGSPSSQKVSLHEKRRFYSKVHTCDFSLTNKVALPVSRTLSMDANLSDPQPRSVNPLLNLKSKPLPPDFTSSSDGDEMPLMFEDAKRGSLDDFKDDDDLNLSLNGNLSDGTSTLELNPLNFKPLNMDDMEKYRYKETSSQSDASEVKTNCEDYEKVPEQTQQNTNKNEITSSNQENLTDNRTMKLNQILSCLNEIRSKHNLPPFNFDASLSTSLNEMLEKNKGRNNEKDLKQNFRNYKNQNFNKFTSYLFKQLLNGQIAKHYVNDQESVKALTHFNNIGIGFYEDPDRDVCAILIYEGTTSNSNISVNKSESPRKSATANGFFEKRSRILFDSINTFRKQNGLNELSFPSANNEKGQKLIKQTKAYARVIGERKIIISSNAFTKELVPNLYSKADGTYVNAKGNDESTLKVIIQKITEGSKTLLLGDFDKIAIGFWFNAENSETTVSIILAKECSE
ncbi:hypothetical protein GPJ56_001887 [Histomonas meleagridis]|uniref:uncharacterized protein n=1 Tax=Histomonas meleagridis TaxID=135588 RepID=UPI003559B235|nr:hypothetical protein GPJ56_001887 [Histomonas meleagridis]KAH0803174.1 hypothetical protein GO595_003910 [Histomonas meleagridis]